MEKQQELSTEAEDQKGEMGLGIHKSKSFNCTQEGHSTGVVAIDRRKSHCQTMPLQEGVWREHLHFSLSPPPDLRSLIWQIQTWKP